MSSKALMDSMVYASGCSLKMVQLAAYDTPLRVTIRIRSTRPLSRMT